MGIRPLFLHVLTHPKGMLLAASLIAPRNDRIEDTPYISVMFTFFGLYYKRGSVIMTPVIL